MLGFPAQPLLKCLFVFKGDIFPRGEHLQCHFPFEAEVARDVHGPHAAFAEAGDHLASRKHVGRGLKAGNRVGNKHDAQLVPHLVRPGAAPLLRRLACLVPAKRRIRDLLRERIAVREEDAPFVVGEVAELALRDRRLGAREDVGAGVPDVARLPPDGAIVAIRVRFAEDPDAAGAARDPGRLLGDRRGAGRGRREPLLAATEGECSQERAECNNRSGRHGLRGGRHRVELRSLAAAAGRFRLLLAALDARLHVVAAHLELAKDPSEASFRLRSLMARSIPRSLTTTSRGLH
ncbi:hypothetical protein OUZ56_032395 [Daphnia magna]|uniref:Uncharacterized protein n=1 Tax=Daphnia magna TaxID=35525 RepID=A0ABR0B8T3_9CRUS|nr:hypothetical protein OUZ56_032395 [Daphnia magna]